MENQGNRAQLIAMYEKRLQNMSLVIEKLHQYVGSDEALKNLSGEGMEKYRIDRVHELVKQIMQSEKQHMLMKILQKLNDSASNQKSAQGVKEMQLKNKQILGLKMNNMDLAEQIKVKDQQIKQLLIKSQRQQQTKKKQQQKEDHEGVIKIKNQQIRKLDKQLKEAYIAFSKLKKDGEEAVKELKQTIGILEQKLVKSDLLCKKLTEEKQKLGEQITKKAAKPELNLKINTMNQKIAFLEEELFQVGKNFSIIKDYALAQTLNKVDKLKKNFNRDSQIIKQQMQEFKESIMEIAKEEGQIFLAAASRGRKNVALMETSNERALQKINQIDNELDFFIQNQLIL